MHFQEKFNKVLPSLKSDEVGLPIYNHRKEKVIKQINERLDFFYTDELSLITNSPHSYRCEDIRLNFYLTSHSDEEKFSVLSPQIEFIFGLKNSDDKIVNAYADMPCRNAVKTDDFSHEHATGVFALSKDIKPLESSGYIILNENNLEFNYQAYSISIDNFLNEPSSPYWCLSQLLEETDNDILFILNSVYGHYMNFYIEEVRRLDYELINSGDLKAQDYISSFGKENVFGLMFNNVCCYSENFKNVISIELL